MRLRTMVSCAVLALAAAPASAGTFGTSVNATLFGKQYKLDFYRIAGDLAGSGPQLQPEGMAWYNGTLYVSGDAGAAAAPGGGSETNGYLAAYAGGTLTAAPAAIGQFATSGQALGPEAITVNTRGSGYGSFAGPTPSFVVIDSAGAPVGRVIAVENAAGPSVTNIVGPAPNADDLAFVPGATAAQDRFAVIDADVNQVRWFSTDPTPTALPGAFPISPEAKGMVYLTQAQAALFTPLATTDCLMLSLKTSATQQQLQLYKLDGTLLGTSTLPSGVAATPTAGTIGNAEALAFDPATNRLFIGDETALNSQIVVATQIPEPGAANLLAIGAACVAAAVRRRAVAG